MLIKLASKIVFFAIMVLFMAHMAVAENSFAKYLKSMKGNVKILVICSEKRLYLFKVDKMVYSFPVALGMKGVDKMKEGDCKTPIGDYKIKWMVSRHGSAKKNPDGQSSFVIDGKTYAVFDTELYFGDLKNIRVKIMPDGIKKVSTNPKDRPITKEEIEGASGEELWTDSYGGPNAYVMALDYPNSLDRKQGKTGSCIEIHASVKLKTIGFAKYPGSHGCISLIPEDAAKVYEEVTPGVQVKIVK